MRSRSCFAHNAVVVAAFAACLARTSSSDAQELAKGFVVNAYDPPERGSLWHAGDSLDLRGKSRFAVGTTLDAVVRPIIGTIGDDERVEVIKALVIDHLGASWVLADRWRLGISLPLALYESGTPAFVTRTVYPEPSGANLGDMRLGGTLRLVGRHGQPFTAALGTQLHMPTGSRDAYMSEGTVRVAPHILAAGTLPSFVYAVRAGALLRSKQSYGREDIGQEFRTSASAGLRLRNGNVVIGPELITSTPLGTGRTTNAEALLSLRIRVGDVLFGAAGGIGLTDTIGCPSSRFLASLDWSPRFLEPEAVTRTEAPRPIEPRAEATPIPTPPQEPQKDSDGDGVPDNVDTCPNQSGKQQEGRWRGCPEDMDGDGIANDRDACPMEPGSENKTDEQKNGCPAANRVVSTEVHAKVTFGVGRAQISAGQEEALQGFLSTVKETQGELVIRIEAHSDNSGPERWNKRLSEERAQSVVAWLVAHGVPKERMVVEAFGEAHPAIHTDREPEKRNNRRVELYIRPLEESSSPKPQ